MTVKTVTPSAPSLTSGLELNTTSGAMSASDTGFKFLNNGNTMLVIKNGSASSITATPQTSYKHRGVPLVPSAITIAAGKTFVLPALDPAIFNDSSGYAQVSISVPATTIEAQAVISA